MSLLLLTSCSYDIPARQDVSLVGPEEFPQDLDTKLHSFAYLLADISQMRIIYAKNADHALYPASLTKIATLDAVVSLTDDFSAVSSISTDEVYELIAADASMAWIKPDEPYELDDLLYGLILPSGADCAKALENYFARGGIDLLEQMNEKAAELDCADTHFVNTTGLHDDEHRMSLEDLYKIILDTLRYPEGRKILTELFHRNRDGRDYVSALRMFGYDEEVDVLGGKTGFTEESGQSIAVFYRHRGHSYVLLLANAHGDPYQKQFWHFEDAFTIFDYLY